MLTHPHITTRVGPTSKRDARLWRPSDRDSTADAPHLKIRLKLRRKRNGYLYHAKSNSKILSTSTLDCDFTPHQLTLPNNDQ
eukprot:967246-Amphidinium_carterae.1